MTFKDIFTCICLGILTVAITVPLVYLWPVAKRISEDSAILLDCTFTGTDGKKHGNPACLPSELLATSGAIRAATGAVAQHMPAIAQAAETASRHSVAASDNTAAVIQQLGTVVHDADAAVKDLAEPLAKLSTFIDSADGAVSDVRTATLPKLNAGVDSLNGMVSDLRPTAQASTALLTAATDDVKAFRGTVDAANAILADPDLATTIHSFKLMADSGITTMQHVAATSVNVDLTVADVHTYLHNVMNPRRLTFWETLAVGAAERILPAATPALISHFLGPVVSIQGTVPVTLIAPAATNPNVKK